MPIGFIFLGVILIFVVLSDYNKQNKIIFSLFCVFTMSAYFVKPLNLGSISINIILIVSLILSFFYFSKNLSKKQLLKVVVFSTILCVLYVGLTSFNSDYITTLNPYPIFFVFIVFSLINVSNFSAMVTFNVLSYLFLSFCNLFVESGLGYVNFASLETFNLMLVVLLIMSVLKLLLNHKTKFKRGKLWKNPL